MNKSKLMKTFILTMISILTFTSCSSVETNEDKLSYDIIDAPINQELKTDLPSISNLYVAKDTIILNSESAESQLGNIQDIKQFEDTLFIQSDNAIYLFQTDGSFIRKINRKGRGHGEYLNITHFDIGNERIHVLDIDLKRILVYNFEGTFIRQVQLKDIVFDFAVLDNGDYLFYNPELYEGDLKRGIWQSDSLYTTCKELVTIDKSFLHTFILPRWFVHINSGTVGLMGAEDTDLIYAINKDSVKVSAKVTTDIVMKKKIRNKRTPYVTHNGHEYAKVSYYETNSLIAFAVNNMFNSKVEIIYDKIGKKTYRIYQSDVKRISNEDQLIPIIHSAYNGICYSVLHAPQLVSMQSNEGLPWEGITMDSNPVILTYATK